MTARRRDCEDQPGLLGWVRKNDRLDSIKMGVGVTDTDAWIHRSKINGNKMHQFIMLLEIKEHGASLSRSQRDTLHIANQLLRNRRNKKLRWQASGEPRIDRVWSTYNERFVNIACFGVHSVVVHGDGRHADQHRITWDGKHEITATQLEDLLLFNLDPDDLSEFDHRPSGPGGRHKTTFYTKRVVTELGLEVDKSFISRS